MPSDVEIASNALIHLGRDPIASFEDEGRANAGLIGRRFPEIRDALLRTYPWNFAMTTATLAGVALDPPEFGFTHACDLPAGGGKPDLLRLWRVATSSGYAIQGRRLYVAQQPPVTIRYVARIEDAALFDPLFSELLAVELALALVNLVPTNEIRQRTRELQASRRSLRREAVLADAMEGTEDDLTRRDRGSWIGARRPA